MLAQVGTALFELLLGGILNGKHRTSAGETHNIRITVERSVVGFDRDALGRDRHTLGLTCQETPRPVDTHLQSTLLLLQHLPGPAAAAYTSVDCVCESRDENQSNPVTQRGRHSLSLASNFRSEHQPRSGS